MFQSSSTILPFLSVLLSFCFPFLTVLGFVIVLILVILVSLLWGFAVVHFLNLVMFNNIASGIFKMV